jgi:hypothetical protein
VNGFRSSVVVLVQSVLDSRDGTIVGRCRTLGIGCWPLLVQSWSRLSLLPPIPPSTSTSLICSPTNLSRKDMPKVIMRKTPPLENNTTKSRTLKRTSSNASLASLPTPPRTIHKRKRSGSRASSVHESGDESDVNLSDRRAPGKRRKVVHTQEVEAREEELFWAGVTPPVGGPSASSRPGPATRSTTKSPEESPRIMTRTQYKESRSTMVTGLQSPPPSRRQPARKVKKPVTPQPLVAPRTPRTPRTPRAATRSAGKTVGKGKSKATKEVPARDSPNNPFLDDDDGSKPLVRPRFKTPEPKTPVLPIEERKTVTYVL